MPEQLSSYNDVVARPACKLLVLLSLCVDSIVLDEVDDGGTPVGVKSWDLLPYGWDQVGLCRRFLFHLDSRAVECLNEHARWYDGPLGPKLGQNVRHHIVVPWDVVELMTIELLAPTNVTTGDQRWRPQTSIRRLFFFLLCWLLFWCLGLSLLILMSVTWRGGG